MTPDIKTMAMDDLTALVESMGQKPYRARQLNRWIYKKLAQSFDDMTDLPKNLRDKLREKARISNLILCNQQMSKDGTRKFLFQLDDGETIESVLIPNNKGAERYTLCISSQAGCALDCRFCVTGTLGFKRNLHTHEIVDQYLSVRRCIEHDEKNGMTAITNIVFMGMGEPLNNLNEVVQALYILTSRIGLSKRKITLSTAGIVPKIYELAKKGPDINLAISLNATTDAVRSLLMPINRKYPLSKLLQACRDFPLAPRRRITFEYILIEGLNDSKEDALRLTKLLSGIRSKVNLIPFNAAIQTVHLVKMSPDYKKSADDRTHDFQNTLLKSGIATSIRKSMGADISAACGQLKAAYTDRQ
ncbi:MAG: 23S rRNA (adenine(2503)-C(2))-methyltransferase RlmN [Nitrospiraceae bacterium]|nr:MAG: 23S rRNA (adenine(2503)-C(2))-methyltransferase RlmN [Nitrospiraceae bacterium]